MRQQKIEDRQRAVVYLDAETMAELDRVAAEHHSSRSEVVASMVRHGLKALRTSPSEPPRAEPSEPPPSRASRRPEPEPPEEIPPEPPRSKPRQPTKPAPEFQSELMRRMREG